MADSKDLIKYMTQQFVTYIETPKEVRRKNRESAKAAKEPWLTRWFGLAPIGVAIWWRGRRTGRNVETRGPWRREETP